jgi:hypothetical protein
MDKEHAKSIPISEILGKLNIKPKLTSNNKALYLSPFRKERTPSFWVYLKENRWYDYGAARGGDLIDLVQWYLEVSKEAHQMPDAIRWIRNMAGTDYPTLRLPEFISHDEYKPRLILKSKKPIEHPGLIQYLRKRGIELKFGRRLFQELHVHNTETKKNFFALGFRNEDGGYELRNPFFKGTLKPKAITFIRGRKPKPDGIHLFEGSLDYASAVHDLPGQEFDDDTIILNSIALMNQAFPYIKNYGYKTAYTWMDNDDAGRKAVILLSTFFQTESDIRHIKMNRMYAPHKDVNAWHMHKHNLTL